MRLDDPGFDAVAVEIFASMPSYDRYYCRFCGLGFFDQCPLRCQGPRAPGEPVVCQNKSHSHRGKWVTDYLGESSYFYVKNMQACLNQ